MNGPEEKWEDRKIWEDERRREARELDDGYLTTEEIDAIKADEKYDDGR